MSLTKLARWDNHFIDLCLIHAEMSKDPSTRVGAVVVGPDFECVSFGFNGFPRGIEDTEERLNNRELKYQLVVHAELNALLAAAKLGVALKGCSLYVAAQDVKTGAVWGGAPCIRCAVHIIQAGITEVVAPKPNSLPERWKTSCQQGADVFLEAGINYREIAYE